MSRALRDREAGFTLIEVLVSLTILGISLAVLLRIFSNGLDLAHDTEADSVASGLAQSLLDDLGTTIPLREGDVAGRFDERYSWQVHAVPYGAAEDRESWPSNPLAVTVLVRWDDGGRPHSVSMTTLRLVGTGH